MMQAPCDASHPILQYRIFKQKKENKTISTENLEKNWKLNTVVKGEETIYLPHKSNFKVSHVEGEQDSD